MASNIFGKNFRYISWGESHGSAIGVVIDGCPAGLDLKEEDVNMDLRSRRPGCVERSSQRSESDAAKILSGVFEGKTLGSPISILIPNDDVDSSYYEDIKDVWRPGHADYTYYKRYGHYDWRGGGRASARETAARVAAGSVAKKMLKGIEVFAYVSSIGNIECDCLDFSDLILLSSSRNKSSVYCPDDFASESMSNYLDAIIDAGDSVGGSVDLVIRGVPAGWGDPVYARLDSLLAGAMLSIPASKSFEVGSGCLASKMLGSEHNDSFTSVSGKIETQTNHCGGLLGGISTGSDIIIRVAFKPTPSISILQNTVDKNGSRCSLSMNRKDRHDPCVAIRAVPVVEAMAVLVLADVQCSGKV